MLRFLSVYRLLQPKGTKPRPAFFKACFPGGVMGVDRLPNPYRATVAAVPPAGTPLPAPHSTSQASDTKEADVQPKQQEGIVIKSCLDSQGVRVPFLGPPIPLQRLLPWRSIAPISHSSAHVSSSSSRIPVNNTSLRTNINCDKAQVMLLELQWLRARERAAKDGDHNAVKAARDLLNMKRTELRLALPPAANSISVTSSSKRPRQNSHHNGADNLLSSYNKKKRSADM